MEIVDVEPIPLERKLDQRFANAHRWYNRREYLLVKIVTDEGVTGWGECYGPIAGTKEIIEAEIRPWLIGRDPRDVRVIHNELLFHLRTKYHTFIPITVVSGIDTALWDAYGRSIDEPIWRLLGGRYRDEVRAYATGHYFRDVNDFEELKKIIVNEAAEHVAAGFDALKCKIGLAENTPWGPSEDVELVRAIRETVGDGVRLMADANHAYDQVEARRVGKRLADLDVYWFEEPIPPANIEGYSELNRTLEVSIAGGECWALEHEFRRVLESNAADFVQPDPASAGGITSTERIVSMVESMNVKCVPHVWGTAVGLASTLQIIATIPNETMLEFDRTPNPIRQKVAIQPIENEENSVSIPDGPGIGIEVDEESLEEFKQGT